MVSAKCIQYCIPLLCLREGNPATLQNSYHIYHQWTLIFLFVHGLNPPKLRDANVAKIHPRRLGRMLFFRNNVFRDRRIESMHQTYHPRWPLKTVHPNLFEYTFNQKLILDQLDIQTPSWTPKIYLPWNTKPHEVWLDIPMDLIVANVRYRKEFLSCSGSVALLLLCRVGSADRNFVDSRLMGDGRGAQRCSCFRTGGAFKYVLFLFLLKGMIQFDSCFSSGLKSPPIYFVWQKMTPDSHHQQMDRSMIWVKNSTQKRGTYKSASFFF